jgi:hypothetical protein
VYTREDKPIPFRSFWRVNATVRPDTALAT